MTIRIEHRLSKEAAKQRMEELIQHSREEYAKEIQDLAVDWLDYRAHVRLQARGYSTAGNLEVGDNMVELDFYLPFLLQVFGKKIRAVIQEKLEESLA
ncbi:MAG TPA: polyhydroxyalkanoic acid system family protein [Puia sp.]|nr:polyhydroxyalkanoic acid system family protein [Puia sp.]